MSVVELYFTISIFRPESMRSFVGTGRTEGANGALVFFTLKEYFYSNDCHVVFLSRY